MDSQLFKLKVSCLFHDPTIKPLVWKVRKGHEDLAREIAQKLNERLNQPDLSINIDEPLIQHADWVAASSDRFIISELYDNKKYNVIDKVYSVNVLDMEIKDLDSSITNKLPPNWLDGYPERFVSTLFNGIDISKLIKDNRLHILYHMIWRFMIYATVKSMYDIKDVALLPADTRVPYYTIFDHLYTTSGLIVTLKDDKNVGRIGIIHWESVGVQGFIQESRALRDLWASSFLVSLMNTAIIIKLAKEHGFDSILSPNMLENPLIDLYLYAHTHDQRLQINFEELKVPITPDKGFAIVPHDKVKDYVEDITKWFREVWEIIAKEAKKFAEDKIKNKIANDPYIYSLMKFMEIDKEHDIEKMISIDSSDGIKLSWDGMWKICGYDIPLNFVSVGESFSLDSSIEDKVREWVEILDFDEDEEENKEKMMEENRTLRDIAISRYPNAKNFQFFEFPIVIEALKKKRKLIAEAPRMDAPRWVLNGKVYVKDRRLICNICYKRPAVIFAIEEIRDALRMIKEDERLCPICLTKRLIANLELFITILSRVYEFADNAINSSAYEKVIKEIRDKYMRELEEKGAGKANPLSIPSLDTISTLTFRNSVVNLLGKGIDKEMLQRYLENISKIIDSDPNYERLFINAPDIRWFNEAVISKNEPLLYIGGEYFIPEELKKSYSSKKDEINNLSIMLREMSRKLEGIDLNSIDNLKDSILVTHPGRYLAMIKADGDNMGKLLTLSKTFKKKICNILPIQLQYYLKKDEEYIDEKVNIKIKEIKGLRYRITPSFYAFVSRALSIIARKVAKIANDYATIIVYAGGDDIVALSPVELSLAFVHNARILFSESFLHGDNIITGLGKNATQSFAIRYFHVFAPLSNELKELNNDLEDIAKEIKREDGKEKNGLIITYTARSGNDIRAILTWDYDSIAEKIFNLTSLTLRYKRVVNSNFNNCKSILRKNAYFSAKSLRDIINIARNEYNDDVINTIIEREFKRHSTNLEDILKYLVSCISNKIYLHNQQYIASVETIKAALALYNALDSKPLVMGVRL